MPFWSSQTLEERIPAGEIVLPYHPDRVVHGAYQMGVGVEAFVTSNPSDKTQVPLGAKIVIPPGQFGLLVTRETVRIPASVIAFISIRAGIKFQGLVNVSGFHVDPGYHGQLKFAVYNAGSRPIVLDPDQQIFMIWFADLDHADTKPYPARALPANVITADDVARIQGEVASPAELKKLFDDLRNEMDKKFHEMDLKAQFIRWLVGVFVTLVVGVISWVIIRPMLANAGKVEPAMPAREAAPAPIEKGKVDDRREPVLPAIMPHAD
jgi:dCTP deaminase